MRRLLERTKVGEERRAGGRSEGGEQVEEVEEEGRGASQPCSTVAGYLLVSVIAW